MNLKDQIEKVRPYNDQEVKDKEVMLKYIDAFDDVLTRGNEFAHFTSSGFILNETHDKVLMVYHNIYDSWAWTGGHVDGEVDFLGVAIREAQEETGVINVKPIVDGIFTIDLLTVNGHVKNGKYVSSHIHINVTYLLEVSEDEVLRVKSDENSNVGWFTLNEFLDEVSEEHMKQVYSKIIEKAKTMGFVV